MNLRTNLAELEEMETLLDLDLHPYGVSAICGLLKYISWVITYWFGSLEIKLEIFAFSSYMLTQNTI